MLESGWIFLQYFVELGVLFHMRVLTDALLLSRLSNIFLAHPCRIDTLVHIYVCVNALCSLHVAVICAFHRLYITESALFLFILSRRIYRPSPLKLILDLGFDSILEFRLLNSVFHRFGIPGHRFGCFHCCEGWMLVK